VETKKSLLVDGAVAVLEDLDREVHCGFGQFRPPLHGLLHGIAVEAEHEMCIPSNVSGFFQVFQPYLLPSLRVRVDLGPENDRNG